MQRLLNDSPLERVFRIINCATWNNIHDSYLRILDTTFQPGDYAILIYHHLNKYKLYYPENEKVRYYDLASSFDRPHEFSGEIFFDKWHMNHRGHKLLAKKLYSILKELPALHIGEVENNLPSDNKISIGRSTDSNLLPTISKNNFKFEVLENYLEHLKSEKISTDGITGSIVMNCNPFTLGHRHLIEEAKDNCDFLYIFIVEEDKSYFPFTERFECVKKGIIDIENVKVLPSGKFIISTLTFPEYFIKEQSNTTIDALLDIKIFAEHIAPILNIKKRFVGNEPFCQITKQYNMAMREILPQYGIELVIFERKEVNSIPISATKVRELLDNENFKELKKFVPESTYKYLVHFKKVEDIY